ncbi:MAG: hypothetical protein KW802_01270 [Candidatus Doudnabacteria bacterium]|nr:hypothetical protein [Candidatus Doudnabacteria bacterium]
MSLVVADFDNVGALTNPIEGIDQTDRKDISNISAGAYLVLNLNNTGKGWVSKTGNTLLSLREGHDAINSALVGTAGQSDALTIRSSEYTGTTSDPVLEVTYYSTAPAPIIIQDATYTYDNNGNILTIVDASGTDTAKTTTYLYDDLNRLTSAAVTSAVNGDNTTKTYTYDAIGNISTSSDLGTYTYAGTGYANPHAVTNVGSKTYTYDNNGNQIGDGNWTDTWDYKNRMTQSAKTGTTVTYTYDPSGQRVKLANGSITTYYPSKAYNTDGTTAQKHIFANGVVIATVKGTGASASVTLDHTDQLTGVGPVTNSSGAMVQLLDYHPFGTFRIDAQFVTGIDEQRKFIGQEYDRDRGLNYLNARYYNTAIGRFISQDPTFLAVGGQAYQAFLMDPQSQNSYGYANNNPINLSDPTGLYSWGQFTNDAGYRYNPLNALFGNNADQIGNAITTGNYSEGLKASGAIAIKTAGVIGAALAIGATGGYIANVLGYGGVSVIAGTAGTQAPNAQKVLNAVDAGTQSLANRGPSNINIGTHAAERMIQRGVGFDQVKSTIQNSNPFQYFHDSLLKTGYYDPSNKIFVGEITGTGKITTVINNVSQRYINNLIKTLKP